LENVFTNERGCGIIGGEIGLINLNFEG